MQRPWEIMMNFQRRLRPAGDSCEENGNNTIQVGAVSIVSYLQPLWIICSYWALSFLVLQLSAAAQRLLPTHNIPATRARRVQNIVDESARIVEESRYPALNNTVGSFCRNCSCDNCSNQTILNGKLFLWSKMRQWISQNVGYHMSVLSYCRHYFEPVKY